MSTLEVKILAPSQIIESESAFLKNPQGFPSTLKFEKHCWMVNCDLNSLTKKLK